VAFERGQRSIYQNGPIKRPNATEALGPVLKVSKPTLKEYSGKHEAILVSSEAESTCSCMQSAQWTETFTFCGYLFIWWSTKMYLAKWPIHDSTGIWPLI
jgi:hypothetical protein